MVGLKQWLKGRLFVRRWLRRPFIWRLIVEMRSLWARLFGGVDHYPILDDSHLAEVTTPVPLNWPADLPKPRVGLVKDVLGPPYWTRFERFLKYNNLPYEFYNVHRSDWLEQAGQFDVIIWRVISFPAQLEEARRKIYLLEKELGKFCFPSHDALLLYEDKIMQYERLRLHDLPVIETFIPHSHEEAITTADQLAYPLVSKVTTGSGSIGVELVQTARRAKAIIRDAFSYPGRWNSWPYLRQKDYVYFQKFQPNEGYDLRLVVAGKHVVGYYRDTPPGDFRASGMDLLRIDAVPEEAMRLAVEVARKLGLILTAVDLLRDPETQSWHIVEIATFTVAHVTLFKKGYPGSFQMDETGAFHFQPNYYWAQEMALELFFERVAEKRRNDPQISQITQIEK